MKIVHNGQSYEITNWNEFSEKLLKAIGIQVESEMIKQVNDMRLVDASDYKRGFKWEAKENELIIINNAPYAVYLEYGTFDYFRRFGFNNFPSTPDPKKKDISLKQRESLPKGMQPFATMRRVLYNQNKMGKIIEKAVRNAV